MPLVRRCQSAPSYRAARLTVRYAGAPSAVKPPPTYRSRPTGASALTVPEGVPGTAPQDAPSHCMSPPPAVAATIPGPSARADTTLTDESSPDPSGAHEWPVHLATFRGAGEQL